MQPELNPYAPGSGLKPPEMVGRDSQVVAFDTMVARAGNRLHNRGMVMSGLRGVGKTVLLNELKRHADRHGWLTVAFEAKPGEAGRKSVRARLGRELLTAARRYNRPGARERLRGAVGAIGSFSASIGVTGVSIDIEPRLGRADSGDLELDLEEMVQDVAEAMRSEGKAFALFVDEMQDVDEELLSALVSVQHIAGQQDWPFYLIGAGLPSLPATLSSARSYAERLFDYHQIGPLDPVAAADALVRPAELLGASYSPEAVGLLVDASSGYPYFLQEYGKAIWNLAPAKVFSAADANAALVVGRDQLDQGFFPARWDRATPAERKYLRAMAVDGEQGSSTGEIARRMGSKQTSLGPARAQLIAKGLVYAPEHGRIAFTVPGMAEFIDRQHGD